MSQELLAEKYNVISILNSWFNELHPFLNLPKSSSVRFHNRQKVVSDFDVIHNRADMSNSSNIKFLDIIIYKTFRWKNQCIQITSELNSVNY